MLERDLQKAREEAATLEARLVILRQRARASARSMQDRGTGRSGRNAAGSSWALARREAEKIEQELRAAQKRVQDLEKKQAVGAGRLHTSRQTDEKDRSSGATELRNNTLYYTHEQAARRLGISALELEALVSSGELRAVSVGGRQLFPTASVNKLADTPSKESSGAARASTENQERANDEGRRTELYYTLQQAAEMLGLDVSGVGRLVSRGDLPVEWVNKQIWYPARPLEDLVRRKFGPGRLARAPEPQLISASSGSPKSTPSATMPRQSKDSPSTKSRSVVKSRADYYTVDEVARKLNKPHHEIWRLAFSGKLLAEPVGDQRLFLKRPVDDLIDSRKFATGGLSLRGTTDTPKLGKDSSSKPSESAEYYTVEQVAEKFGMDDVDDVWHALYVGRLKVEEVRREGQRVFSKRGIDALLRAGEALRASETEVIPEVTAASSLTEANAPPKPKADPSSTSVGSNEYYTVEQVAEKLGMDNPHEVWHLPNVGQLKMKSGKIAGQRVFSKEAVDKLISERKGAQAPRSESLQQAVGDERTPSGPANGAEVEGTDEGRGDPYYTPAQAEGILGKSFYKAARKTIPTITVGDRVWVKAEAVDSLAMRKYGGRKLHGAPTPHQVQVPKGDDEEVSLPPSHTDLQGLRETNERLTRELQREREERSRETQRMRRNMDQLEAELENVRRSSGDGALGLRLRRERELRQEAERHAQELHARLDEEKRSNSGRARRLAALEAELDHGETRRKELEDALSAEKVKTLRLERSERLLDEMRRLLGAVEEDAGPSQPDTESTSTKAAEHAPGKSADELQLRTPFGQVSFFPPFPLDEQDEELLRLIAKEDELTAEQIRRHTGRRRAAGELEDLLDRLADEGVNDLVVEVSEDRYRFNPAALQNN